MRKQACENNNNSSYMQKHIDYYNEIGKVKQKKTLNKYIAGITSENTSAFAD
jgi:hypothetical protein